MRTLPALPSRFLNGLSAKDFEPNLILPVALAVRLSPALTRTTTRMRSPLRRWGVRAVAVPLTLESGPTIVKEYEAGLASTLPLLSIERTSKTWAPSGRLK